MNYRALLAETPLFAGLIVPALDELVRLAQPVELPSGRRLFAEGEVGDHFYIIATGRLRITARGALIGYAGRLEPMGEIGMITGEPRSGSAYAIRDSLLLRIERLAFLAFLQRYPSALVAITRVLITRLLQNQRQLKLKSARSARTFAVIPASPRIDAEAIARRLALQMSAWDSTRMLQVADVDAELGPHGAQADFADSDANHRLMGWLNQLELHHRYLVYVASREPDAWSLRCMRQADRILVVAEADDMPMRSGMLDELRRLAVLAPVELVMLWPEAMPPGDINAWCEQLGAQSHYYLRPDHAPDIDSLARQLTGRGIGLVLGGGGARGFAHIGLIRALEHLQIPVDVTAGSSMGAFIAALLACGWNSQELAVITRETFVKQNFLNDYVLPRVSLIRGRKFLLRLLDIFGERSIEHLRLPYFCVSTNLTRGAAMVHARGQLATWVATSMAVPGFAPPVAWRGELFCDGAVINSLPTDIMQSMERGPIIASDVSSEGDLSALGCGMDGPDPMALLRWKGPGDPPSLRDILFRTATLTSESGVQRRAERADLYLRMPVEGIGMFDWKRIDALIEAGYRHALAKLEPLKDSLLR
jgi:predicted acylesterase/phospholipase RssA/CRP-like cAMP-binding protein